MRTIGCFVLLWFLSWNTIYADSMAKKGVLDLRQTPLEQSGPVNLSGDWHFYWGAFIDPGQPAPSRSALIRTPATWGSQELDISDHGFGTYALHVVLSDGDVGRGLGLYLPSVASAYDLYVNGDKLASAGRIGTSREAMKPAAVPQSLYFTANQRDLRLVVHVSNFTQRKGGIWDSLRLGTADQMAKEYERRTMFQTFIAAGLLLMGIYHIGHYSYRPEKSALFFGLACLSLFLRSVFVGEMPVNRLIPSFPWEVAVKIEYMSVYCGISFLVLYFYHLYVNILHRAASYGMALLLIAISLPILFLPARVYTEWMSIYTLVLLLLVLYIMYGLIIAVRKRRKGAVMNLAAGAVFLATVLNDILYYHFLLETVDLVTLGLFLFIFTQMFMLSEKFAAAYREIERLTVKLEGVNGHLEATIAERTAALLRSNEKLKHAEAARKDLLSSIAHELGNPLTSIIGYLRRLRDGESRDLAPRHIEIAYRKALGLERLTDDLRQLVKLEHDQLTFRRRPVELGELYRELQRVYDWELLDRRVRFRFDEPEQGRFAVLADPDRLEQVFANIVHNALAHTQAGGEIAIAGRLYSFAGACAISVRDSGTGIRQEDQKRLFDRFYRVGQPGSGQPEGTGLGLSIAKAIVEAHDGKIGVRSRYGHGSTFYIILPVMTVRRT